MIPPTTNTLSEALVYSLQPQYEALPTAEKIELWEQVAGRCRTQERHEIACEVIAAARTVLRSFRESRAIMSDLVLPLGRLPLEPARLWMHKHDLTGLKIGVSSATECLGSIHVVLPEWQSKKIYALPIDYQAKTIAYVRAALNQLDYGEHTHKKKDLHSLIVKLLQPYDV